MRFGFRIGFALALSLALMAGCSDENGEDGGGGTGGVGGNAAQGGAGGSPVACVDLVCPCTETGIRAAVAEGGGPFTFDCDGPQTVVTQTEIVIDKDVELDGEGNLTVDGNGRHHVFSVNEQWMPERDVVFVSAELEGLTVTNSGDSYAGIANRGALTVTNSSVSGNNGAGISNVGLGRSVIVNSTISRNVPFGIMDTGAGVTLMGSTVSNNDVGIVGGHLTIINSTISENTGSRCFSGTSFGGCYAGGILGGQTTIRNSTVSGNSSEDFPGGPSVFGAITATNTLIDGSCGRPVESGGGNIESPGNTCGFDQAIDQVSVPTNQLALGPLQDNGGPTHTHALLPDSVAVDAIAEVGCLDNEGLPLATDQRGEPRPAGPDPERCDVGSFELGCSGSACIGLCADAATRCEDLNPCTDDICDPFTGTCSNTSDDDNSCDTCSGVNGGCVCRAGACVDCTLPEAVTGQVVRNACRNSLNEVVSEFSVVMDVALNQCALERDPFSADVTAALVLDTTFLQVAADFLCDLGAPLTEATVLGAQVQIDSVVGADCVPELSVLSPVPQDVALDVTVTGVCGAGGSVVVNSGVTLPFDPVTLSCTAGTAGETVAICSVGLTPRYLSPGFPRTDTWIEVSVPGIPEVVAFGCGGPATTNPAPGEEVGCDVLNSEWEFTGTPPCSSVVGAGTFGETPSQVSDCQLDAPPTEPIDCGDVECPGTCETVPIALPWSECATFPVDR